MLFRCPATVDQCTDESPCICRPYFHLKEAVSPHLEPYYDTYAAPYVDLARPYYAGLDRAVLNPTWTYAVKHGAPRVAQAQALAHAKWQENIQPTLGAYQDLAVSKYQESLAPHVDRASAVVAPYYDLARTNALRTYHQVLLPSFSYVQPYILQGYGVASAYTTQTALPSVLRAWTKTYVFLDGTVWPHLRIIYAENVQPQLVKIGQRLGRYSGKNTQRAVTETLSKYAPAFGAPTAEAPTAPQATPPPPHDWLWLTTAVFH